MAIPETINLFAAGRGGVRGGDTGNWRKLRKGRKRYEEGGRGMEGARGKGKEEVCKKRK